MNPKNLKLKATAAALLVALFASTGATAAPAYKYRLSAAGVVGTTPAPPLTPAQKAAAEAAAAEAASRDPHFANVSLLMHFDGSNGSTALTDVKGHVFTYTGSPHISTAMSKFGGSSLALTEGDRVSMGTDDSLYLNGEYTVEYWMHPTAYTSVGGVLVEKNQSGYSSYGSTWRPDGAVETYFGNGVNGTTGGLAHPFFPVNMNAWNHIVVQTRGESREVYINGTAWSAGIGQVDSIPGTTGIFTLAKGFTGYIDEVRITKGVARYAGSVPSITAAFPSK